MNKHLKLAFFIAPLLAIGAYILTGYLYSPYKTNEPQYKLHLMGQCLPTENSCIFIADPLEVKLISNQQNQQHQLAIISNEPISRLTVALGLNNQFTQFKIMKSEDDKYWQIKLNNSDNILKYKQLRMAFTYQEQNLYTESEVIFSGN